MKNTLPYITLKKTNKNSSSNTSSSYFSSPTIAPKPSRNSLSPKAPSFLSETQIHRPQKNPSFSHQTETTNTTSSSTSKTPKTEPKHRKLLPLNHRAKKPSKGPSFFPFPNNYKNSSDKNNHNKHIQQQPTRIKEIERQREKGGSSVKGKSKKAITNSETK